jgi:hypothetical protein
MLRSVTTRVAGLTILILGIWGGIIPFVGPYFHFTLGPDHTWTWTAGRFYLSVLPAIGAVVGGLLLLGAGPWAAGRLGALLALLAGVWFAIGPDLSLIWRAGGDLGGGVGSRTDYALERLSFHTGLGVLIAALAAFALPAVLAVRTRRVEPVAQEPVEPPATAPATAGPSRQYVDQPAEPVGAGTRERSDV